MATYGRLKGGDKLLKVLRTLDKEMTEPVRQVVASAAAEVESGAKARVPVDTGELRDSIEARLRFKGLGAQVGVFRNTRAIRTLSKALIAGGVAVKTARKAARKVVGFAFYGHFLEFGTVNMPAQPFLFPAWAAVRNKVMPAMASAAKAVLKAQGK